MALYFTARRRKGRSESQIGLTDCRGSTRDESAALTLSSTGYALRIRTKFDDPRSRSAEVFTTTITALSGAWIRFTAASTTLVITCSMSPLKSQTIGITPCQRFTRRATSSLSVAGQDVGAGTNRRQQRRRVPLPRHGDDGLGAGSR